MKKIYLSIFFASAISAGAFSQVNFSNGSNTYTETFDAMGTGAVATLPANWKVSTSSTARTVSSYASAFGITNYNGGNDMSSTANSGIYNFGAGDANTAPDRSLGALGGGSGNIQSVNFYLLLKNTGTVGIDNFTVSFNIEKYRRGTTGTTVTLYYSSDGVTFTPATNNGVPASTFAADVDNNGVNPAPASTNTNTNNTFTVSLGTGGSLYLAWNYSATTGTFNTNTAMALGLDDVKVVANYQSTLPVSLANFRASERTNAVNLNWTAFNESNMLRHDIEKSSNGAAFTVIGSVPAQNNSTTYKYDFLDATPIQGNNYYRLRSVSNTGDVTYSSILRVNLGATRTDLNIISNPVIGHNVHLQLTNFEQGKYAINVYNSGGQKVYSQPMELAGGSSTQMVSLPSNISRGNYFLQLTNGYTNVTKEIMVQ